MINDINKTNLVVQHNALIESAYELTTLEKKIMLCAISTINSMEDEDFSVVNFNVKEIAKNLNTNAKNMYSEIEKAVHNLEERDVKELLKDRVSTKWVASSKYFPKEGRIELGFSPHLKPYLLKLGKQIKKVEEGEAELEEVKPFTSYSLNNGLVLKSFHSIRLYELLKQYEKLKKRLFTVDGLKKTLQLEGKYSNFNSFNKRVLEKAKKEINDNTDLKISYEALKDGRSYKYIEFTIDTKQKIENKLITKPKEIFKEEAKRGKQIELDIETKIKIDTLKSVIIHNLKDKDYIALLDAAEGDAGKVIQQYYLIKQTYIEKGKDIGNLTGLLIKAIKGGYDEVAVSSEKTYQAPKTKFHNFDQRTSEYTPEELEKILAEKQKKRFE